MRQLKFKLFFLLRISPIFSLYPDLPESAGEALDNLPLLLTVVVLAGLVLYGLFKLFSGREVELYPYELRPHLLTAAERKFFTALQEAVSGRCLIFAQVRVADVVQVTKGTQNWGRYFNRIKSKHVDFLLCDARTVSPLMAVELDDSSHDRPDRQARDRFMDRVFHAAGLPLLHVPLQKVYSVVELRALLASALLKRTERRGSRPS